ncbi:MAG: family 43 glycosylhydrolase [Clostridia bacterium]|nr:family 43 glycosylhydrolase [Clostridia bacterium]
MRRYLVMMTALLLCCGAAGGARAEAGQTLAELGVTPKVSWKKAGQNNPLYTQRFGADPGVMEYQGRIYVYMTDDIIEYDASGAVKENSYSQIRCINCISSDDLVNWTDHGRIPVAGPTGIARWAQNSWAPCAAHKTMEGKEKFFLYFCNGGNGIGVLTSDSPTGPWRDELGHLLITRATPNCANVLWLFDPAVMVDEDGRGYLAFGGGVPQGKQAAPGTARIVRLGEDMLSLDGDPVTIDAPYLFEDSGINRIGGKYVYTYCSNWQTDGNGLRLTSGAIQYMTADEPLGLYTYMGELFPNQGKFFGLYGNNHHSIASLGGEYYFFYHNRPVEQAMGITGNYRSPQIDRLRVSEDGTLGMVIGTMQGIRQLHPLNPSQEVLASTMADQAGIEVLVNGEGLPFVRTSQNSWIKVSGVDFGAGGGELTIRASAEEGCTVWVLADRLWSGITAEIVLPAGEETTVTVPLAIEGQRDLFFVFSGPADFFGWRVSAPAR